MITSKIYVIISELPSMRKNIAIERKLANKLKLFVEKKHGFVHVAIKAEAEIAINNNIRKEAKNPNNRYFLVFKATLLLIYLYIRGQLP